MLAFMDASSKARLTFFLILLGFEDFLCFYSYRRYRNVRACAVSPNASRQVAVFYRLVPKLLEKDHEALSFHKYGGCAWHFITSNRLFCG